MEKTKLYKIGNTLLSILIAILAICYLIYVLNNKVAELNFSAIKTSLYSNFLFGLLVLSLMPLNWFFEVVKWKLMINRLQQITVWQAVKSISFGISLALITPNKIGDFGGRLLYIAKEKRWQALYYDSFLSLTQLLVTISLGIIGGSYYVQMKNMWSNIFFSGFEYVAFLLVAMLTLLFLLYKIKGTFVNSFLGRFNGKVKLDIDIKIRTKALIMSLFRFLVFSTQFYILIWIFDYSVTINHAFIGISTIYLITSILPTGWISDLAVRTSVAFYIFNSLGYSGEAALLASSLLWVINLLIPAMFGLLNLRGLNWMTLKEELKGW
ncbi:MAG: flippase-like domain-containing protein [Flavobacteriales bacterium]|nr:flippase-like domain-containing protein [Flavobacteriales bacterium]